MGGSAVSIHGLCKCLQQEIAGKEREGVGVLTAVTIKA
jgi:hypothetical protein